MRDKRHYIEAYLARLQAALQDSHNRLVRVNDSRKSRELIILSSGFVLFAAILFFYDGYYTGFAVINAVSYQLPESLLQMLTFMGDTLVCLALLLPFARRNPAILVIAFVTAIYGSLVCQVMKNGFDMPRPPAMLNPNDFFLTGKALTRHSFPSGHSLTIFSFLTLLYYFASHYSTKVLLIQLGSAVALSRVLVGAHWPIDVFIGSALGIVLSLAAIHTAKYWKAGFSVPVHFLALAIVITGVLLLFSHDGGYPKTSLLATTLASVTLLQFARDYVMVNSLFASIGPGFECDSKPT